MKKTIITGALAAALIATGGTGLYMASAKENSVNPAEIMKEQGIDFNQMTDMMKNGDSKDMQKFMDEQGVDSNQMTDMMKNGNVEDMQKLMDEQNISFGQMKPQMENMHPDLSTQELEQMYKDMHGTGGAENSKNFQGMNNSL